jgi:hypothetical protein
LAATIVAVVRPASSDALTRRREGAKKEMRWSPFGSFDVDEIAQDHG